MATAIIFQYQDLRCGMVSYGGVRLGKVWYGLAKLPSYFFSFQSGTVRYDDVWSGKLGRGMVG
jgi:hypothetical protein